MSEEKETIGDQMDMERTCNHTGKKRPSVILTDPKEVAKICWSQPNVSADHMRRSILKQNGKL